MNNAVPNPTKHIIGRIFASALTGGVALAALALFPATVRAQDVLYQDPCSRGSCGRPEFATISPKLKAMANERGQRLEQSFTELQQLELTPLQRQWAAEQTQTLRLLPADR